MNLNGNATLSGGDGNDRVDGNKGVDSCDGGDHISGDTKNNARTLLMCPKSENAGAGLKPAPT